MKKKKKQKGKITKRKSKPGTYWLNRICCRSTATAAQQHNCYRCRCRSWRWRWRRRSANIQMIMSVFFFSSSFFVAWWRQCELFYSYKAQNSWQKVWGRVRGGGGGRAIRQDYWTDTCPHLSSGDATRRDALSSYQLVLSKFWVFANQNNYESANRKNKM